MVIKKRTLISLWCVKLVILAVWIFLLLLFTRLHWMIFSIAQKIKIMSHFLTGHIHYDKCIILCLMFYHKPDYISGQIFHWAGTATIYFYSDCITTSKYLFALVPVSSRPRWVCFKAVSWWCVQAQILTWWLSYCMWMHWSEQPHSIFYRWHSQRALVKVDKSEM